MWTFESGCPVGAHLKTARLRLFFLKVGHRITDVTGPYKKVVDVTPRNRSGASCGRDAAKAPQKDAAESTAEIKSNMSIEFFVREFDGVDSVRQGAEKLAINRCTPPN